MTYQEFCAAKASVSGKSGFHVSASDIHPMLKPHQRDIVRWALDGGRRGRGVELNTGYFLDGVKYCRAAEAEVTAPTLFDFFGLDNKGEKK